MLKRKGIPTYPGINKSKLIMTNYYYIDVFEGDFPDMDYDYD